MKVHVGRIYRFQPNALDLTMPQHYDAVAGQVVRVIQLPMSPRPNVMGQCHIEDKDTHRFLGMVSTGSLTPFYTPKGGRIMSEPRALSTIAADIRRHWPTPYFGAVPYLEAMSQLSSIGENYYADSAESVVLYFLSNATTWRGEEARRLKAELKALLPKRR